MAETEKTQIPEERFYYDDPNAPIPNVPLLPGAASVIFDSERRILFMKRKHGDYWCLPGGRIDLDESAHECCIRETLEETGLQTRIVRLISTMTHPRSVVHYPDGNVHRSFFLCYEAEVVGGELLESAESEGFRWLSSEELDTVRRIPDSRTNALDAWANRAEPFLR